MPRRRPKHWSKERMLPARSAWAIFYSENFARVKATARRRGADFFMMASRRMGRMWKGLSPEQRQFYKDASRAEHAQFDTWQKQLTPALREEYARQDRVVRSIKAKKKAKLDQEIADGVRPRKAMSAYQIFNQVHLPIVAAKFPNEDSRMRYRILGYTWRNMPASERGEYFRRESHDWYRFCNEWRRGVRDPRDDLCDLFRSMSVEEPCITELMRGLTIHMYGVAAHIPDEIPAELLADKHIPQ